MPYQLNMFIELKIILDDNAQIIHGWDPLNITTSTQPYLKFLIFLSLQKRPRITFGFVSTWTCHSNIVFQQIKLNGGLNFCLDHTQLCMKAPYNYRIWGSLKSLCKLTALLEQPPSAVLMFHRRNNCMEIAKNYEICFWPKKASRKTLIHNLCLCQD